MSHPHDISCFQSIHVQIKQPQVVLGCENYGTQRRSLIAKEIMKTIERNRYVNLGAHVASKITLNVHASIIAKTWKCISSIISGTINLWRLLTTFYEEMAGVARINQMMAMNEFLVKWRRWADEMPQTVEDLIFFGSQKSITPDWRQGTSICDFVLEIINNDSYQARSFDMRRPADGRGRRK